MSSNQTVESLILRDIPSDVFTPSRTALLIVDIQRDFAAPDGVMAQYGANLEHVGPAIEQIRGLLAAARKAGICVVFVRVVPTPESDSAAAIRLCRRRHLPEGAWAIGREATRGAEYFELAPLTNELDIRKPLYSAFHKTDLDERLRDTGIETLVVTGIATDCCVNSTVRDAFHRDYDVFVVADACAAYDATAHEASLIALSSYCSILVDTHFLQKAWA